MHHSPDPNTVETFETFFNGWLNRQQLLLDQLLLAIEPGSVHSTEHQQRDLIEQVLSHYRHYYGERANAAKEDVFTFFSPPWLSGFERTLLWLGEFRPSVFFRLIDGSVKDLTPMQSRTIEQLKAETKREERELSETMAMIQESIASPPILGLAMRFGRLVDGEVSEIEAAIQGLKTAMLAVLERGDAFRGSMMGRVMAVLSSNQTVRFLAAAAEFQLREKVGPTEGCSQK